MQHPVDGPNEFKLDALVYPGSPGEIAVGLMTNGSVTMMGLRWCAGNEQVQTWPGEETGWFIVPFTFAAAIGRSLAQLKATGHAGIDSDGFDAMASWLIDNEGLDHAMCYQLREVLVIIVGTPECDGDEPTIATERRTTSVLKKTIAGRRRLNRAVRLQNAGPVAHDVLTDTEGSDRHTQAGCKT